MPARGEVSFGVHDTPDLKALKLDFTVANAFIAPRKPLTITLRPMPQ